jgi:hypothetical protein
MGLEDRNNTIVHDQIEKEELRKFERALKIRQIGVINDIDGIQRKVNLDKKRSPKDAVCFRKLYARCPAYEIPPDAFEQINRYQPTWVQVDIDARQGKQVMTLSFIKCDYGHPGMQMTITTSPRQLIYLTAPDVRVEFSVNEGQDNLVVFPSPGEQFEKFNERTIHTDFAEKIVGWIKASVNQTPKQKTK